MVLNERTLWHLGHDWRPVGLWIFTSASVDLLKLRFVDNSVELWGIGGLPEDLLLHSDLIHELLQDSNREGLKPSSVDYDGLAIELHVVSAQFLVDDLKHGDRQLSGWVLVEVKEGYPPVYLAWNYHVVDDVVLHEVEQVAESRRVDLFPL